MADKSNSTGKKKKETLDENIRNAILEECIKF